VLGFTLEGQARAPVVWGMLLATAAVAWAVIVRAAADMRSGPGTMGLGLAAFMGLWVVMMAAMMLPSVAPLGSMYVRGVWMRSQGWLRVFRVGTLIFGYLAAWATVGLVAFACAWGAGQLAAGAPRATPWVGAGALAVAGVYQLTPLKDYCLKHCRSPIGFLLHFGSFSGRLRDLRVGLFHGAFCIGCCWGLMIVLVAVGVMNLAWMAALAAVIFLEKTWRYGKAVGIAFGLALIVLAVFIPTHPGLVPGLHPGAGMAEMAP
jgi:predicted metal-binding membrane protein